MRPAAGAARLIVSCQSAFMDRFSLFRRVRAWRAGGLTPVATGRSLDGFAEPFCLVVGVGWPLASGLLPATSEFLTLCLALVAAAAAAGLSLARRHRRESRPATARPKLLGFVSGQAVVQMQCDGAIESHRVLYEWGSPDLIVLRTRGGGTPGTTLAGHWLRLHRASFHPADWRAWQRWRLALSRRL